MTTVRLTVGQAVVRFLAAQRSERDGTEHRLIEGCFGIFGHGNVAGLGQGLLEAELGHDGGLRYLQGRNEQAMVHAAAAFARTRNRMSTLACTSSVGPGGNPVERVTITERLDVAGDPQALAGGGAAGVDQLAARGQGLEQVRTKTALTPVRPLP